MIGLDGNLVEKGSGGLMGLGISMIPVQPIPAVVQLGFFEKLSVGMRKAVIQALQEKIDSGELTRENTNNCLDCDWQDEVIAEVCGIVHTRFSECASKKGRG